MRNQAASGNTVLLGMALATVLTAGCAASNESTNTSSKRPMAVKNEAADNQPVQATSDPNSVSQEKLE